MILSHQWRKSIDAFGRNRKTKISLSLKHRFFTFTLEIDKEGESTPSVSNYHLEILFMLFQINLISSKSHHRYRSYSRNKMLNKHTSLWQRASRAARACSHTVALWTSFHLHYKYNQAAAWKSVPLNSKKRLNPRHFSWRIPTIDVLRRRTIYYFVDRPNMNLLPMNLDQRDSTQLKPTSTGFLATNSFFQSYLSY